MILAATPLFWLCTPAVAQNAPAQDTDNSAVVRDNRPAQFDVTTARDLFKFDQFLDSHPQIADQLRSKPWLVINYDFLQAHPDLAAYLQDHPQLASAISQNPTGFVNQEMRWDQPGYKQSLAQFDRFLDTHPNIARDVRSQPWLVTNYDFVQAHPELRAFFQANPQLGHTIGQNPVAFMQDEQAFDTGRNPLDNDNFARGGNATGNFDQDRNRDFDNRDRDRDRDQVNRDANGRDRDAEIRDRDRDSNMRDRDRDFDANRSRDQNGDVNRARVNHGDVVVFDHFMDSHPEVAEQIRKNPSLIDNRQFVQNHPALQTFLQEHSQLQRAIASNPNAFMQAESRFEVAENRHSDFDRGHLSSFGAFLDQHSKIAREVSDKPDRVNDKNYLDHHHDLQQYLASNPDVQQDLATNPSSFVKSVQQMKTTSGTTGTGTTGTNGGTSTKGSGSTGTSTGTTGTGGTTTTPSTKPTR